MPFEVLEVFESFAYGLFGWRYIFSSKFRQQIHTRWRAESWLTIGFEIILSAFGMLLTLLPLWLLVIYIW